MRQYNINIIILKNRFMMKHIYINKLINKLFTFAKVYQN